MNNPLLEDGVFAYERTSIRLGEMKMADLRQDQRELD
jgi:hypothetical protein